MKLKTMKATLTFLLAAALCAPVFAKLPTLSKTEKAAAQSVALDYIDYNASEITATEDYSAVVDSATATTANGGYWASNRQIVRLGNMQQQLDNGKSGLLLTSQKSGDNADGATATFKNTLFDDFSMDFRVFSQETYQGFFAAMADNPMDDRYNPFLDIKEVGITLTSVSNPKVSFTIDVRGASSWATATVNASVYVPGESYETGVYRGYGVMDSDAVRANYATNLLGTSFCNVSASQTNESTKIEVDMQTMKVYGVSYETAFIGGAPAVTEKKMLIRDLVTNKNSAGVLVADGLGTVNPEDFKNGYTVSITMNDVTSNATEVRYTKYNGTGDGFFTGVETLPISENGATVYERKGNIIVYSVNGQSLKKSAGFTAEQASFMDTTYYWSDGKTPIKGSLDLRTTETGLGAEGASFTYNDVQKGEFEQEFMVYSFIALPTHINNTTTASLYAGGNGYNADDAFPQVEVKQVGFQFVSNSDPTKTFTLYIRATSGTWAQTYIPSARVAIAGDKIRNVDFEQGYGLNTGRYRENSSFIEKPEEVGKFNPATGSKLDGGFGNFFSTAANGKMKIKFDPVEMKVYGMANGEYALIRDLAGNSGAGVPLEYVASLSAEDFKDGYTVKFTISDVTRDGFTGIENAERMVNKAGTVSALGGNTPKIKDSEAAARTAKVIFNGLTESDINLSKTTAENASYNKLSPVVRVQDPVKGVACDLAPIFGGLLSTNVTPSGNITYKNGDDVGEIVPNAGGRYEFTANKYGTYTLTIPIDWNGETATVTAQVRVKDIVAPVVSLKDGLQTSWIYNENEQRPILSEEDVEYFDDSGVCSLEITVTRDKKSVAIENAFEKAGVYEIIYLARDEFDNAHSVTRKFVVYEADVEAPEFSILGGDRTVRVGEKITVPTYTCVDNYDGEVSANIKVYFGGKAVSVVNGEFTADSVGKYVIYYTAEDEAGNTATRTVTITVKSESGCGASVSAGISGLVGVMAALSMVAVMKTFRKKEER